MLSFKFIRVTDSVLGWVCYYTRCPIKTVKIPQVYTLRYFSISTNILPKILKKNHEIDIDDNHFDGWLKKFPP